MRNRLIADMEDEFSDPYFTEAEQERLRHWRAICAHRSPTSRSEP